MGEGQDWKDWARGPFGRSLVGATYGAGLGWAIDKLKDERGKGNKTMRRIAVGALLGSLAGSALSQYRLAGHDSVSKALQDVLSERRGS